MMNYKSVKFMKKNVLDLILCMLVFTWPQLQAQEEQDDTTKHNPAEYLSNTLPVLYINTVDETPIVDRENYIDGDYYLDANGCGDYQSVGSAENPLPLVIRGRGNATWQNPKKPYRLKLESKASLLGMPKSKHWILLSAYADWMAHGRTYFYFNISDKMGMPYTPGCVPCEVVLNGDYIGMYFLTEQIRIAKERVNITEQAEEETDPDLITGGWLLEIDNYQEANQLRFIDPKKPKGMMKVTYHNPEVVSAEQLSYITNLINNVNEWVNTDDKTSREWEEYIDIDALARYYVVEEVVDDLEGFSGSSWFYKDNGDCKLTWGPVWDAGSTMGSRNSNYLGTNFIYENEPSYACNHWIAEIAKFPRFQIAIRKWWKKYKEEVFPTMQGVVNDFGVLTSQALASDYRRWGDKSATALDYYRKRYVKYLTNKRDFLALKWDTIPVNNKWTTYYSDINLALPQGIKAFIVNGIENDKIMASEIGYIPSHVGVLLYGDSAQECVPTSPYYGETQEFFSLLQGCAETQEITDGYILFNDGFVLVPNETLVQAHHCYLPIESDATSPTIINIHMETIPVFGDVNGDGHVTSVDVAALYNYMLNGDDSALINGGDLDGDGHITSVDITVLYNIMLGE